MMPSQSCRSELHFSTQRPATHSYVSMALDGGQAKPHAPQLSLSALRFTSHGNWEVGQVVKPAGHLFEGQYDVSPASGATTVSASGYANAGGDASYTSAIITLAPQPPESHTSVADRVSVNGALIRAIRRNISGPSKEELTGSGR
jgi:hypothetical protein